MAKSKKSPAEDVADYVLAWVDNAGYFSGKDKERKLLFSPVIQDGEVIPVYNRMVSDINKIFKISLKKQKAGSD